MEGLSRVFIFPDLSEFPYWSASRR